MPPVRRERRLGPIAVALGFGTALHGWCAAMLAAIAPSISAELRGSSAWLTAGFFLAAAVAAPIAGRLADLLGARRVAGTGLIIITTTSVIAALAPTMDWLTAARTICGIGTAMQYPAALAAVRQAHLPRSGPVLTIIVLGSEASFTAAPGVAGLIDQGFGWRIVLLSPLVLALPALALQRALPNSERGAAADARQCGVRLAQLDIPGLTMAGATITVLIVGLQAIPAQVHWPLVPMFAGLILLTWLWERHYCPAPFLPHGLLSSSAIRAVLLRHGAFYLGYYLLFYLLPRWFADSGITARTTALVLIALPVITIASRLVMRHIEPSNARSALITGAVFLLGAALIAFGAGSPSPIIVLIICTVLMGVPNALVIAGNQAILYAASPPDTLGLLSGVYRSIQFLGGAIATATLTLTDGGQTAVATLAVVFATTLLASSSRRQHNLATP